MLLTRVSWSLPARDDFLTVAVLFVCAVVAGACKVEANVRGARITMCFAVTYFTFLLLGTSAAILVSAGGTLASMVFRVQEGRRSLQIHHMLSHRALYNCASCVLATAVMSLVYVHLGGTFGSMGVETRALPILASALVFYLANTWTVTLAISWAKGINPYEVFRNHSLWALPGFLASASISAGALWAYEVVKGGPIGLLFLPPAYLVYYSINVRSQKERASIEHVREVNRLNDDIISSLATAIDAKDRTTSNHLNRVREYSTRLAERLGVGPEELQAIRIASLLHDIGKIGIPEHILCKQGKLTPEEFDIIKSHVEIGAAILEKIHFPWPVVPVVRTHHERWDGLGYPRGMKGEEIPIGGRIISLVDVYDALTSDRPYRRAMPRDQAVGVLRANSGTQFDPSVVETFIALLPDMDAAITALQDADGHEAASGVPEAVAGTATDAPACDEADDALVLNELADVLVDEPDPAAFAARLAQRLDQLVPYSTFALYLVEPERPWLRAVHAAGLWTNLLQGMEIRMGEGVTGYVAAHGEAVENAPAILDLGRRVRPFDNLELNSTLCVPLVSGGEVVGAITVYNSAYSFYQPYHRARLERVALYTAQVGRHGGWLPGQDSPTPGEAYLLSEALQRQLAEGA